MCYHRRRSDFTVVQPVPFVQLIRSESALSVEPGDKMHSASRQLATENPRVQYCRVFAPLAKRLSIHTYAFSVNTLWLARVSAAVAARPSAVAWPKHKPCRSSLVHSSSQQSAPHHQLGQQATLSPAVTFTADEILGEHPSYGGCCTLCGGYHHLPCTPEAVAAMHQLLQDITQHQRLDFDSTGPADPRFGLEYLFTRGPGRMLGVLVAVDAEGCSHVLRAFSGQITECWHITGWAGPVAGIINISPVYVKTRRIIESISGRMQHLAQQQQQHQHQHQQQHSPSSEAAQQQQQQQQPKQQQHQRQSKPRQQGQLSSQELFRAQQQQLLKRRRRALSYHLLQQIQHSYITSTVGATQQLSLLDTYLTYRSQFDPQLPVTKAGSSFVGMPAGAGDCCAPKLLHAAAQQRLMPVALCEVWFGSAPGTATKAKQGRVLPPLGLDPSSSRQHCRMYGPCEKCAALLGTMLCPGLPEKLS